MADSLRRLDATLETECSNSEGKAPLRDLRLEVDEDRAGVVDPKGARISTDLVTESRNR